MGHALMDKVMLQWGDLPGNAFKVLFSMARYADDDAGEPVYSGGWEPLAASMGRDTERTRSSVTAVHKAISDATQAGALRIKEQGKPGLAATYVLHLDRDNPPPPLPDRVEGPAVESYLYRLYDTSGGLLYVGVTNLLTARLAQHEQTQAWWSEVASHDAVLYESRAAVVRAEALAIRDERPRYNIAHPLVPPLEGTT